MKRDQQLKPLLRRVLARSLEGGRPVRITLRADARYIRNQVWRISRDDYAGAYRATMRTLARYEDGRVTYRFSMVKRSDSQ